MRRCLHLILVILVVFISLVCKSHRNLFLSMGDSGHFVLARWTNDEDKTEIEMTAFKVKVVPD